MLQNDHLFVYISIDLDLDVFSPKQRLDSIIWTEPGPLRFTNWLGGPIRSTINLCPLGDVSFGSP